MGCSKKDPGKSPPCMFSFGVADMARDQQETTLSYIMIDARLLSVPKREILSAGEEFIQYFMLRYTLLIFVSKTYDDKLYLSANSANMSRYVQYGTCHIDNIYRSKIYLSPVPICTYLAICVLSTN